MYCCWRLHRGLPKTCRPLCSSTEDKGGFSNKLVLLILARTELRGITMNTISNQTEITKTYRRHLPNTWWLKKGSYFLFMLRELSSVFVALYAIFLLIQLYALSGGLESYESVSSVFKSGWMIILHVVMWLFVMYNMVTWFRISGRIFGAKPLSPILVTVFNYIIWIIVSIVIIFLLIRG